MSYTIAELEVKKQKELKAIASELCLTFPAVCKNIAIIDGILEAQSKQPEEVAEQPEEEQAAKPTRSRKGGNSRKSEVTAVEIPAPVAEEVTEQPTEQPEEVTEQPLEQELTPEDASSESVFTVYTTAGADLDDSELTIKREVLEVKTAQGKPIYKVEIIDAPKGDVVAQLGDYLFNCHNAVTYQQWLKITSDNEVIEGKINFPAMPKNITEEKILSLVESAEDNSFGKVQSEKRIAEIQAQIAALQEELRTLKKSSKSKTAATGMAPVRVNVFKGDTFQQTIELCQTFEADGLEATMAKFGKTKEYVTRAYRAYAEIYSKSDVIKGLYDSKKISWAAIYKIAGSNPAKIGMAAIENKARAVAKA
jgi:uncharacterized small protein (DUF1192 family)